MIEQRFGDGSAGGRSAVVAMLAASAILVGCGGHRAEIPVGCARDAAVPAPVRKAVIAAADQFYSRAATGDWRGVYKDASHVLRGKQTESQFAGPMSRAVQRMGTIPSREIEALTVVHFGPAYPHLPQVECPGTGGARPLTLLLDEQAIQASLVERATIRGDSIYLSTLWHREGSRWRLAAFFLKPATLFGKSSAEYEAQASEEREVGNDRNSALLYNVAIDLSVPNAWTRPGDVDALSRKQSRLAVTQLPVGKVEAWPAPKDTFQVRQVGYTAVPAGLAVLVRWLPGRSLADTTALGPEADRLHEYVVANFPEYPRVFAGLVLEAEDPSDPSRTWTRRYRLGKGS